MATLFWLGSCRCVGVQLLGDDSILGESYRRYIQHQDIYGLSHQLGLAVSEVRAVCTLSTICLCAQCIQLVGVHGWNPVQSRMLLYEEMVLTRVCRFHLSDQQLSESRAPECTSYCVLTCSCHLFYLLLLINCASSRSKIQDLKRGHVLYGLHKSACLENVQSRYLGGVVCLYCCLSHIYLS